jgi:hypothetical protein
MNEQKKEEREVKILQIMPAPAHYYAVYYSDDSGEVYTVPVVALALVQEWSAAGFASIVVPLEFHDKYGVDTSLSHRSNRLGYMTPGSSRTLEEWKKLGPAEYQAKHQKEQ